MSLFFELRVLCFYSTDRGMMHEGKVIWEIGRNKVRINQGNFILLCFNFKLVLFSLTISLFI